MDLRRLLRTDTSRRRPTRGGPPARGAPFVLPAWLDVAVERWWALAPRWRVVLLGGLAVVALALVGRGATASPWGPPREVLVAAGDRPAGHPLSPADARPATWPEDLVPTDALAAGDLASGGDLRLAAPVADGAVLTRAMLVDGVAGLLDDGDAAVAVPVDGLPALVPGDGVDVVAARTDGGGQRLATGARVLALDGDFLWLGVPADRVDAVAAAGAAGRLTLAVRPVRGP